MRVLLVEDNADLAANVGDYLAAHQHSVDFAYDGPAGLQAAIKGDVDVIILDRVLPGLDGASVCRQLRGLHGIATPVLMLTAMDALADRSEEHTSELQSLMRISYAVFCLKKKNIK